MSIAAKFTKHFSWLLLRWLEQSLVVNEALGPAYELMQILADVTDRVGGLRLRLTSLASKLRISSRVYI